MLNPLIQNIQRYNPDLKTAEIEGILYIIKNSHDLHQTLENNDLIRLTGLPKEELRKFKSSISNLLNQEKTNLVSLSDEGAKTLLELVLKPYTWTLLKYETPQLKEVEEKLWEIRKKFDLAPSEAKREYDQWFATANSSVEKVQVMQEKGAIKGKHILLLGDDDLLSIVLGLMNLEYSSVTVVDIDDDILNKIAGIAKEYSLKNIYTQKYDARTEVPTSLIKKFDVVVTDPPYTKFGIALFLNKALEFLGAKNKYIFLYYGNSFKSPEKTLKVQEIINNMNLVVEDKLDKFIRYHGAESIGSASSLYVLKTTQFSKPLVLPNINEHIYTFESQAEEKFPFVDHVVAKVWNVNTTVIKSKNAILRIFGEFCRMHKLKIVDTKITPFANEGLTLTLVLSSSNLVVHTWPEYNALHIDLVTCTPIYNKSSIYKSLVSLLNTKVIELREIE